MAWARVATDTLSRRPMRARYFRKRLACRLRRVPAQSMASPPQNRPITGLMEAMPAPRPRPITAAGRPVRAMPNTMASAAPPTMRPRPRFRSTGRPCRLMPWVPGVCRGAPPMPWVPGACRRLSSQRRSACRFTPISLRISRISPTGQMVARSTRMMIQETSSWASGVLELRSYTMGHALPVRRRAACVFAIISQQS